MFVGTTVRESDYPMGRPTSDGLRGKAASHGFLPPEDPFAIKFGT